MNDDNDKSQLPIARTSLLAGGEVAAQEEPPAVDDHPESSYQKPESQEEDINAAAQVNTPPESPTSNLPDISVSRPSTSSNRGPDHVENKPSEPSAGTSVQPEETAGEDESASTIEHEQPESDDVLPPSPPPKRESRPESEVSMPTQESSAASRRSSVTSNTSTTIHSRSSLSSLNKGSAVFVISALEQIESSKEAKGSKAGPKALREASQRALEMVKNASGQSQQQANTEVELDPRVVFEPLRLACLTGSTNLIITSLDCLGKLVSYSFFAEDTPNAPSSTENEDEALSDLVTSTVCDTYHDALDERAQLQIIKALLAVVLSTSVHVHQSSLLKAVRTVYNIFLGSKSTPTQAVAQGVLTQMVHHVFGRVPRGSTSGKVATQRLSSPALSRKPSEIGKPQEVVQSNGEAVEEEVPLNDGSHDTATSAPSLVSEKEAEPAEKVTLRTLENRASFEGASERDTAARLMQQSAMSQQELFVKDAFLVLRALCKLSMKPLTAERCV
jgi:brefeldin A-inhibited guanine nucleotide-exchange protein